MKGYRSKTCKKCRSYYEDYDDLFSDEPPDTCTYCRRFYEDYFEEDEE